MKLFLVGLVAASAVWAQASSGTLTICEVLRDRLQYNGKIVKIRGVYSSTDEGTWLVSPECDPQIKTDNYGWRPVLWLTVPTDRAVWPAPFAEDTENRAAFRRLWAANGMDNSKQLKVTIIGRFDTYTDLVRRTVINRVGERMILGYGHMNQALGQLIIQSYVLDEVAVEDAPKR